MVKVISVRLHGRGKPYHFDPGELRLRRGDAVIVETVQGIEFGICSEEMIDLPEEKLHLPLKPVLRLAEAEDEQHYRENQQLEKEAFGIATERIRKHKLEMNLVDVEYLFDNRKIIFFFTADGRIDFRELVKDLASIFRTRIELRQIGVRDEARLIGGLGICGRELCCCSFLGEFMPVSIKMAKEQNLSMNPAKISGACGRLLCCLKYEQAAYEDARARMPRRGAAVTTEQGTGTVVNVNLLKEQVLIQLDGEGEQPVIELPVSEISFQETPRGKRASRNPRGGQQPDAKREPRKSDRQSNAPADADADG